MLDEAMHAGHLAREVEEGPGADGVRSSQRPNKSVARALRILASFDEGAPEWSVSELARHLGVSKSSVSTMLATLADFDLVSRSEASGRYRLGLRCLEMGYLSSSRLRIRDLAFPLLERLLADTRQIVYLAIPYQEEVLYVEAMYPPHRRINYSSQGRRAPLYCTGIGKAVLAFLAPSDREAYLARSPFPKLTSTTLATRDALEEEIARIRNDGYAVDRQEREHGIQCVAAPVLNRGGIVTAALSVSGSAEEIRDERIGELAHFVTTAAMDVARKLQFAGHLPTR